MRVTNNEAIWWIPGNVPSLKNSKIKTSRGIFPSKTVVNYLRSLNIQGYNASKKFVKGYKDINKPNLFLHNLNDFPKITISEYPIILQFHFIRKTKAEFDFNNANQILLDLMTAHNLIVNDSMKYVLPFPLKMKDKYYNVDKNNPGVYIELIY